MVVLLVLAIGGTACSHNGTDPEPTPPEPPVQETNLDKAEENLKRSLTLTQAALERCFKGNSMLMMRYYYPFAGVTSLEKASVWMYTSSFEAVNALLSGMEELKEAGRPDLYNANSEELKSTLGKLFDGLDWYKGTYTLTSYTQTKEWSVYGVNRGNSPGTAKVDGVENVYDDQEWLVRELLNAHRLTGESRYLEKAEYLAEYVLDGWDCTLKSDGTEHGGITWGPGYYTKHSCSNGPFVSPLVWLSEIYSGKNAKITHRYIGTMKQRLTEEMDKSEYYLMFAKKVYAFQKNNLFRKAVGVYYDMLGAKGSSLSESGIAYETVGGVRYRANNEEEGPTGTAYSYNSGTMLSGAADLYRVTGDKEYLTDMTNLSNSTLVYFAKKSATVEDCYDYDVTGFNNWFNGVLLRGWVDVSAHYSNVSLNITTFQNNLDHGYTNYLHDGFLPPSLLYGWNTDNTKNKVEGMFAFAFAAEYAEIARYLISTK